MTDWFIDFGIFLIVIFLSLSGMLVVRKSVKISTLESHNDVAGFVYAVVGVIYTSSCIKLRFPKKLES